MNEPQGKEINATLREKPYVPIWEKVCLTIEEAAAYSNLGINLIASLTNEPLCPFVLHIGRRRLVKRKEFEKYLSAQISIKTSSRGKNA